MGERPLRRRRRRGVRVLRAVRVQERDRSAGEDRVGEERTRDEGEGGGAVRGAAGRRTKLRRRRPSSRPVRGSLAGGDREAGGVGEGGG